jgi:hypothetical protein
MFPNLYFDNVTIAMLALSAPAIIAAMAMIFCSGPRRCFTRGDGE